MVQKLFNAAPTCGANLFVKVFTTNWRQIVADLQECSLIARRSALDGKS
tara:strand:+ start:252 stop:398 length:147 start_codon:yes stop_codon:yes gene_type:complete